MIINRTSYNKRQTYKNSDDVRKKFVDTVMPRKESITSEYIQNVQAVYDHEAYTVIKEHHHEPWFEP